MSTPRKELEDTISKTVCEIFTKLMDHIKDDTTFRMQFLNKTIWQLRFMKNTLFRMITEDTSPEEVKVILEDIIEEEVRKIKIQKKKILSQNLSDESESDW